MYNKPKAILFYGLMDTPQDVCKYLADDIIYSNLPTNERWIAYKVDANPEYIEQVKQRVLMCRVWLESYDILVKSTLGRLNKCATT